MAGVLGSAAGLLAGSGGRIVLGEALPASLVGVGAGIGTALLLHRSKANEVMVSGCTR